MVEKGIADVAYVSTGYQAGRMLVTSAAQLPFMMSNAEGGSKAFDEWYRPYAAKDLPGVKMCYMYTHDVATLHSKKEIRTPDQIKGMKIRPAHATMAAWMTSLGATTVQVSAPESREALERGVADAITFPWGSLYAFQDRWHHQVPHRCADVCRDVCDHHQHRQVQCALGRPEEDHRRPLHDSLGRQDGRPNG